MSERSISERRMFFCRKGFCPPDVQRYQPTSRPRQIGGSAKAQSCDAASAVKVSGFYQELCQNAGLTSLAPVGLGSPDSHLRGADGGEPRQRQVHLQGG